MLKPQLITINYCKRQVADVGRKIAQVIATAVVKSKLSDLVSPELGDQAGVGEREENDPASADLLYGGVLPRELRADLMPDTALLLTAVPCKALLAHSLDLQPRV